MWKGKTVSVIFGTYAERDSIYKDIQGFFETGVVDEIIVVNNNAEPGTTEEVARTNSRQVFEPRQGYGWAYRRGLAEATGDLLVLCEPDGTFLPRDIMKLLTYSDDCDAVFGTRTTREMIWRGANMGFFLKWGNWAVAKMVEVLFNTSHLSDVGCTYRLLTRDTLKRIENDFTVGGSHFGPELMLLIIVSGARVVEVPVNYLPRVGESSVTGDIKKAVKLGLEMIVFILRFKSRRLTMKKPEVEPRVLEAVPVPAVPAAGTEDVTESIARLNPFGGAMSTKSHTIGSHGQTDFDAIAAEYDDSLPAHVMSHYEDKRATFIRQNVAPGTALDVGCGTGVMAERLTKDGYDVTGVDPFQGMLTYLKQRNPAINTVNAVGQKLPFPDNTFDLTYCVAVMHHVANPKDVQNTLKEMSRVTKLGGHVLIWDHNPRNPYWPILMKRVPQDTGAERLIPEREILDGLIAGGATPTLVKPLGLMPDFTPKALLGAVAGLEGIVERLPLLNRLCAHNVILAVKAG